MGKRASKSNEVGAGECCAPLAEAVMSRSDALDMAEVFAALGDPVRLQMLSIIAASHEVCSCNLEGPLAKSQPTISHHTRVLAEAGLIVGEKRGRWTWWRSVPERLDMASRFLEP
ncbi:MAG: helix-turn-helix transcriptional regulator [Acidimicrobiaceae bacterium]|nr:helix-turn-helix transcriptional regulator [Acidimicrobiaceae bacterium]